VVVTASGLLAGLLSWASAAADGAGVGLGTMLSAGLNVVPPAVCVLGVGLLTLGVWPRGTSVVTYGLLTWSLLIQFAGGFGSNHWLLDTSVFHQMAAAPAVSPDWTSAGVLAAVGVAAAVAGGVAFRRRDLAGA
jgi:ABC-2 type transport system permease protein